MRLSLLSLLLLVGSASAQESALPPPRFAPTLDVGGVVTARTLYLREEGLLRVALVGQDTVRVAERQGLPEDVQPGTLYGSFRLHFRLAASPLVEGALRDLFVAPEPGAAPPPDDAP